MQEHRSKLHLISFPQYRLKCREIIQNIVSIKNSRRQAASLSMTWGFIRQQSTWENCKKKRNNFTSKTPFESVTVHVDGLEATFCCLCAASNCVCPKKIRTSPRNNQWDLINSEWQGPVAAALCSSAFIFLSCHARNNSAAQCRRFRFSCGLVGFTLEAKSVFVRIETEETA